MFTDGPAKKPTSNNHDSTRPSMSPPPPTKTTSKRKLIESQPHSESDSSIESKVSVHSIKSGEKKRKPSSDTESNLKNKKTRSKSRSR